MTVAGPKVGGRAELGYLLVLVTVCGWGLNWPLLKILLRDWPPLLGRGVSSLAAGLGLAALAVAARASLRVPRGERLRLAATAFTNVTAWMGGATMALRWLSVAEAALLVYTMPIWAMLLAWPVRGERPSARGAAGLALGLAGLAVLFSGGSGIAGPDPVTLAAKLPGIAIALGAATLFAFGTVASRNPTGMPPVPYVAWQVGLGSLPMLLAAALFERSEVNALTAPGFGALAYMAAVPMGLCYLTWFAALKRLPAPAAASGTLLVPLIGVASAALMLGEPLGARQGAALVLVLSGVLLSLRRG